MSAEGHRPWARGSGLALALASALALAVPAGASAQPPRRTVTLTAEGVFGNETLLGDGYGAVAVTVNNTSSAALRGRVQLTVRQWQQSEQIVEAPLDVPAGEARRVILTPFVADSATLEAAYVLDGGASIVATTLSATYGQSARALVVLADPPRLRGALLDMSTNVRAPAYGYGGGGTQASGVPLGLVAFDARTGDPILPTTALGWSGIGVLAASAPVLVRLGDEQREALLHWVHAGGRVIVFPRTDADLALPFVRELFADLSRGTDLERVDGQAPIAALACGSAHRERFGCSRRVGFGAVYVVDFDGAAPPYVELPTTRAIVQGVVDQANGGFDPTSAALTYGRRTDELADTYGYYGSGQRLSFGRLRAALDPNEGYRPALALVGIVLFLYVLLVGPINFWFVGRRKTPTLALATTPVAALLCAAVMFGVGYLGKGVLMRYRRVEIVEAVAGDGVGLGRRYTGYYFTRPAAMDTESAEAGAVFRLLGGSGGVVHQGDTSETLRGASGSLWETVFTREEHEVSLGQGVSFGLDDHRLATVHNASGHALRSAFIVDASGNVYVIGDVADGTTVDIPRDSSAYIPNSGFYDVTAPEVGTLRDALGLTTAEGAYALGIERLIGTLPAGLVPVLYAQTDPDPAPSSSPSFAAERDLRILRIVPDMPVPDVFPPSGSITPVEPAPPPSDASESGVGHALSQFFGGAP